MQMPLKQYQQTNVSTSSPEKILLMLYDGAINFSRIAMDKAAKGDNNERGKYVSKAQAIVAELMNTLDHEVGGVVAERLTQLYMYIINEYVRANVNNSVSSLENTVKILGMLRDTWAEAIEIVQKERGGGRRQPERADLMDSAGLEKEINRGKGIFTEIVRVTSDFFESFEALGPDDIRSFEVRRQRLLEDLLAFQSAFRQKLAGREKDLPLAMAGQLEEFRIFQEVFVQIIMEKNGAILSKANQSLERVRAGLDAVGRGKQAMRGYNRKRSRTRNRLDKTA